MFYQSALFLGYAYAHALVRLASPRLQWAIHGIVFGSAALLLPVLPGDRWRPDGALVAPDGAILAMLFANVALPFLALAATGPLVQAWFARLHPDRSPYPLYAVSNVGSLLALGAYPFVIEPRWGLSSAATVWGFAFFACGAMVLACGYLARGGDSLKSAAASPEPGTAPRSVPLLWLLLAATAVVALMAVTNRLCLDLASVPFLWVLPLGIYLLTFILCFGSERAYRRTPIVAATLLVFLLQALVPLLSEYPAPLFAALSSIYGDISLHCALLFGVCMLMHGELYRLRPAARHLTFYYLCVSGGGALGGIFVGIVAARIFDGYHELPLGLGMAAVLVALACGLDSASVLRFGAPRWRWAMTSLALAAGLLIIAIGSIGEWENLAHAERNFFGILRVFEYDPDDPHASRRTLTHGNTLHGIQYQNPARQDVATAYFGRATGIGLALAQRPPEISSHVGVVGLGAGTLAAYGRAGDRFRFYEIDPDVIRLARDEGYFSFLRGSAAEVTIVPGDARLSLRDELRAGAPQEFDVLVLDAFSSDSIPVHLLTVEAFRLFAEHLGSGGLIAAHLSNRHLQLSPLVVRLGERVGMESILVHNRNESRAMSRASRWVLLSRDRSRLLAVRDHGLAYRTALGLERDSIRFTSVSRAALDRTPLWTDDYSDLFRLLTPIARPGGG